MYFDVTPNRKRLQTLQNKGLRCALNKDIETSSNDLHKDANLLKLNFRREQHLLNFMFDQAQIPSLLKSKSGLTVRTRASNKKLLKIKRPYTEKFKKSLAYQGPKKWNALPETFQHTLTKATNKTMVYTLVKSKSDKINSGAVELNAE